MVEPWCSIVKVFEEISSLITRRPDGASTSHSTFFSNFPDIGTLHCECRIETFRLEINFCVFLLWRLIENWKGFERQCKWKLIRILKIRYFPFLSFFDSRCSRHWHSVFNEYDEYLVSSTETSTNSILRHITTCQTWHLRHEECAANLCECDSAACQAVDQRSILRRFWEWCRI